MDFPDNWVHYEGFLIIFCIQKFIFTALTLSCPLPGGIFMPIFSLGAVFG
jgi:H+/Cl- antiporter ClcA